MEAQDPQRGSRGLGPDGSDALEPSHEAQSPAQEPQVSYQVADGVAQITLLHPALTALVKAQLLSALNVTARDKAIRAVIITGAGKSFCAGQDLREHAEALERDPESAFDTIRLHYNPIIQAIANAPKPVISSINGSCAGAGLSLALACDLRVAASGIRFATAFSGIGLSFDSGLSATLARAVGAARASELIMLGEPFTAEDALAWGLVGHVVPPEELSEFTWEMARKLASGPTQAYAMAKAALASSWAAPLPAVLESEAKAQEVLGRTQDHQAAVRAFLAREKPVFGGWQ